jgi:hypothetical protein
MGAPVYLIAPCPHNYYVSGQPSCTISLQSIQRYCYKVIKFFIEGNINLLFPKQGLHDI